MTNLALAGSPRMPCMRIVGSAYDDEQFLLYKSDAFDFKAAREKNARHHADLIGLSLWMLSWTHKKQLRWTISTVQISWLWLQTSTKKNLHTLELYKIAVTMITSESNYPNLSNLLLHEDPSPPPVDSNVMQIELDCGCEYCHLLIKNSCDEQFLCNII